MTRKIAKENIECLTIIRNHILLYFPDQYVNVRESKIKLQCEKCNIIWETAVNSYKNSKNGCPLCKANVARTTHKGKTVSELTRAKIGVKCSARPGSLLNVSGNKHPRWKGGYGRSLEEQSNKDYEWKNQ